MFGVLVAFAGGYGFHRDELYFMANARHPAWGYVDHPPMTPMLGWLSQQLFGDTVRGLRVLPALVAALFVAATVLVCRELGGDARAQRFAAIVTSTTAFTLALGHMLTTPSLDVLWWTLALLVLIRIVRTSDPRWWLVLGTVLGLGLLNKFTVLFAIASYGAALLWQPERAVLRNRWVAGGVLITVLVWSPHLWWQVRHHWPLFEFTRAIADEATDNRLTMLPLQVLLIGPPVFAVAVAGWRRLMSDRAWRPYRFVAVGPVVCIALLLVTGGKPYYSTGAMPAVLAAGSIVIADHTTRWTRWGVLLAANLAINAVIGLPVLPVSVVGDSPVAALNPDVLETIGWPQFVDQVAAVADLIPADRRSGAVVMTGNYGEAGALERWGPSRGLPPVYSGHNSYRDFGVPPGSTGPVVVVGWDDPTSLFRGCTREATLHTRFDVDAEEKARLVWLCDAPVRPWAELWPVLRHVD